VDNGVDLDLDLGAIAPLRPGVVNLAQPRRDAPAHVER
jgi:hypothetical protein